MEVAPFGTKEECEMHRAAWEEQINFWKVKSSMTNQYLFDESEIFQKYEEITGRTPTVEKVQLPVMIKKI